MPSEAAEKFAEARWIGNEFSCVVRRAGLAEGYDAGFAAAEAKHAQLLESLRWAMRIILGEEDQCAHCHRYPCKPDCPWLLAMQRAGVAEPPGQRRKGE